MCVGPVGAVESTGGHSGVRQWVQWSLPVGTVESTGSVSEGLILLQNFPLLPELIQEVG